MLEIQNKILDIVKKSNKEGILKSDIEAKLNKKIDISLLNTINDSIYLNSENKYLLNDFFNDDFINELELKKELKLNFYTTYYRKLCNRIKQNNDIYIKVSQSIVCFNKTIDNEFINNLIDIDAEFLYCYDNDLKDYYNYLITQSTSMNDFLNGIKTNCNELINNVCKEDYKKELKELTKKELYEFLFLYFYDNLQPTYNIFFICHENLEKKYTEKNEAVKMGLYTTDEFTECHRMIIAKFLKNKFNINVKEYDIKKENEKIVYRDYKDFLK